MKGSLNFAAIGLLLASGVSAQLPQRDLVEVFRIGGIDAPRYAAFSQEPKVIADFEGKIYVLQTQPPLISVFTEGGDFLREIGREGQGPGEFRIASGHGLLADTLWVIDPSQSRMSFFDSDGNLIETKALARIDRGPHFPMSDGMIAPLLGGGALQLPISPPTGVDKPIEVPLLFGDRNLERLEEIGTVVTPKGLLIAGVGTLFLRHLPTFPPLVSIASSGIGWLSMTDANVDDPAVLVSRRNERGKLSWSRELRSDPVRISDAKRRELLDEILDIFTPRALENVRRWAAAQGLPVPNKNREEMILDALDLPEFYAPFDLVLLGRDGSTWLRRGGEGQLAEWVVLSPSGVPQFEVVLARTMTLSEATLQSIWTTHRDDLDVPYVVRWDIRE